jgi:hypothetical protein
MRKNDDATRFTKMVKIAQKHAKIIFRGHPLLAGLNIKTDAKQMIISHLGCHWSRECGGQSRESNSSCRAFAKLGSYMAIPRRLLQKNSKGEAQQ